MSISFHFCSIYLANTLISTLALTSDLKISGLASSSESNFPTKSDSGAFSSTKKVVSAKEGLEDEIEVDSRVVLSDDEDEERRKAEQSHNLQFVKCISSLVQCCCSLIADLPTFRKGAEVVTKQVRCYRKQTRAYIYCIIIDILFMIYSERPTMMW